MKRIASLDRSFWLSLCALVVFALPLHGQELVAPPLGLATQPDKLSSMLRLYVREFRFEGNKVFSSWELAKVIAPYTGREISSLELEDARRAVSDYYVGHGYINSGAVLPDQDPGSGVVVMRITEGALSDVQITGNRWLRDSFIRDRVERWAGTPLNINELKVGLQLLRENPNVDQINAELKPDVAPGTSILDLHVKDQNPFQLGLQVDNDRPPSVGADEILLLAADRNLTGHSDPLELWYGIAEGGNHGFKFSDFNNVSGSYSLPLTAYDTTLRFYGSKNDYAVIEEPFEPLGITSESYRAGVMLRQPVFQTANQELALALAFEREHSSTFLNGAPYDVTPGSTNGTTDISALRVIQEWIVHNQSQVLALRSTFSFGLDVFGVTKAEPDRNGRFFAWLGQGQYVQRLFNTPNQLVLRAAGQVTPRPLLSLEQFSLGGPDSVRGYRVNQLVRDDAAEASAELRLPVVLTGRGDPVLQFAPFADFGGGWDVDAGMRETRTIWSAGAGLLYTPNKHLNAQLYWGHAFRKVTTPNNDLQDLGLYFKVTCEVF